MVARYAHQNGAHIQIAMTKLQDRMERLPAKKKAASAQVSFDYTKITRAAFKPAPHFR
jgi:hypothetical protein